MNRENQLGVASGTSSRCFHCCGTPSVLSRDWPGDDEDTYWYFQNCFEASFPATRCKIFFPPGCSSWNLVKSYTSSSTISQRLSALLCDATSALEYVADMVEKTAQLGWLSSVYHNQLSGGMTRYPSRTKRQRRIDREDNNIARLLSHVSPVYCF